MALSGSCWAFAMQNGTSAATTAVLARSWARSSAFPDVVHPSWEKPITAVAIPPMTTPQTPGLSQTGIFVGYAFDVGGLISSHRHVWINVVRRIAITSAG